VPGEALREAWECFATAKRIEGPPRILIVGDGSERKNLETLCQTLGIKDRVLFVGMRSDAQRFYPLFDCFALSSHSEGLSIALLEALSFGLPVITTHTFAHHDVITHGVNGFLISPRDIDAYAKHLEIIYNQPDLCVTMREANTLLVEKQFSIDATVNAYVALYEKACASRL
jgi:glycosyltransferase involved in cell wall biosynthesis